VQAPRPASFVAYPLPNRGRHSLDAGPGQAYAQER